MEKFVQRDCKGTYIKEKIDKANNFDGADLLNRSKISENYNRMLLVIYYRTAPNVHKIGDKH